MENEIIKLIDKYKLPKFKVASCVCCNKSGLSIPSAIIGAEEHGMNTVDYIENDASYSPDINGYVCDECYRKVGEPRISVSSDITQTDLRKLKLSLLHRCVVAS